MSTGLVEKFVKRTSEYGALFHLFPGSIYEFRDKVWRVKTMEGSPPISLYMSNAFQRLMSDLKAEGIVPTTATVPRTGTSEVFPQTWCCENPTCNRLETGTLRSRACSRCGKEMRQVPLVVVCDNCGYVDGIRQTKCERCNSGSKLRLVMYERENIGSWRVVCQTCLDRVLQRERIPAERPELFQKYSENFRVWSDLEPGTKCPRCGAAHSTDGSQPGKNLVPAGANVISPQFTTKFDQDMAEMKSKAITTASKEMGVSEDKKAILERIRRVFGIKEIYFTEIMALSCTYGYRVGKHPRTLPFQGNNIYVKADDAEALIFEFDPGRIPQAVAKETLHSAAHAFVQVAGYVTGLGNEAYHEHYDPATSTAMIFTTEAGGCGILLSEVPKLLELLKKARAVVHNCKNQCGPGCPWCIQIRPFQCSSLNRELNRTALASLWKERFVYAEEEEEDDDS